MDAEKLSAENEALKKELATLRSMYERLALDFQRLGRARPNASEKVPTAQLSMMEMLAAALGANDKGDDAGAAVLAEARAEVANAMDDAAATEAAASSTSSKPAKGDSDSPAKKAKKANPHGRRKPVVVERELVIEPPERLAPGGDKLVLIGQSVSYVVERKPSELVYIKVILPTYKLPDSPLEDAALAEDITVPETAIVRAPPLPTSMPKAMLGPTLVAYLIVAKYADHLPLNRLERIFARDGVRIARSTSWDAVATASAQLDLIVQAMWADARRSAEWIATDATGILVQAPKKCEAHSFFVVCAERRHVLFSAVERSANGENVSALLSGFRPGTFMISDASTVFHEVQRSSRYVEVGCWAHARRMFFDAIPTQRAPAIAAIGLIGLLFEAHRSSKDEDGEVDVARRRALAAPILAALDVFDREERLRHADDSALVKALNYVRNQREALRRFLDDGRLRLDNNISELELRREVVGRKNWLFCASDSGVRANTTCVSLIASCALHDVNPLEYLHDVLLLLPTWSKEELDALMPVNWGLTRMRDDVSAMIAERSILARSRPVATA
jgi:transposase